MQKVIANLESVLANTYSLYLKTQNYHWNVTGPNFKALHELFQLQYEEMIPAIDEIAERIRTLDVKVDGTYENFASLSVIASGNRNLSAQEMVADLVEDNLKVNSLLQKGVEIAHQLSDEATADILIKRMEHHQKAVWMLRSSL
tara:strand:+ start:52 stop:483 length:432 start_codon:yes stop_codon:yes gene_type:complete